MMNEDRWNNNDNDHFYNDAFIENRSYLINRSGLQANQDLLAIKNRLMSSASILEIGAGYGRVIDFLIQDHYSGHIAAIEKSDHLYELLLKKFSHHAHLYHGDIREIIIHEKFNLILWLWCGIADFNSEEQRQILSKLKSLLTQSGAIIIDTVQCPPDQMKYEKNRPNQMVIGKNKIYRNVITLEALENIAEVLNLKIHHLSYETDAVEIPSKRTLSILE
jgi:SAM-dependent methyltransferase